MEHTEPWKKLRPIGSLGQRKRQRDWKKALGEHCVINVNLAISRFFVVDGGGTVIVGNHGRTRTLFHYNYTESCFAWMPFSTGRRTRLTAKNARAFRARFKYRPRLFCGPRQLPLKFPQWTRRYRMFAEFQILRRNISLRTVFCWTYKPCTNNLTSWQSLSYYYTLAITILPTFPTSRLR